MQIEYWDPIDYPLDNHIRDPNTLFFYPKNEAEAIQFWFYSLEIRTLAGPPNRYGSLVGPPKNCRYACIIYQDKLVRRVR